MTEEEKMQNGAFYNGLDAALTEKRDTAQRLCAEYNACIDPENRGGILHRLLGKSEGVTFQGPVYFTYGCYSRFGAGCYANFNLTVLDHAGVTVGERVMFGPNCTLVTAIHPMHHEDRSVRTAPDGTLCDTERAEPITIGADSWLGANVTVCPGVTIGARSVIGAGSVVTKDVPPDVFAAGVPCRVIRPITDTDRIK